MTRKHSMLYRYDDTVRDALEAIKNRDGVPFHEQLRRGLLLWMASKDVKVPRPDRKSRHG